MEPEDRNVIIASSAVIVAVGLASNLIAKTVVKKRRIKKLNEYVLENLACINASKQYLDDLIAGPDFSVDAFEEALKTEAAFMSIVRNQPKY